MQLINSPGMRSNLCLQRLAFFLLCLVFIHHRTNAQSGPLPPNQLSFADTGHTIRFTRKADSMHGRWEPFTALLLPVRLQGCPKVFYMQFDLGAPTSIFYRGKMNAIRRRYPTSIPGADTAELSNFSFLVDTSRVTAKRISLPAAGNEVINWKSKSIEIIGTLGTDLIDGRVLVLDYPGRKLILAGAVPPVFKDLPMSSFMYMQRSVLLPAVISGKKSWLFFDTGSSAFELLTNRETCEAFPKRDTVANRFGVASWNKTLLATTYHVLDSIRVGNAGFVLKEASFIEGAAQSQIDRMMKLGIGGMTGNRLFLHAVLVLDTRKRVFGIPQ